MTVRSPFRRVLLTGALMLLPALAHAHAILEDSDPKAGGAVAAGKVTLTLRFNSRIDRARSRLILTQPAGAKVTLPIDPEGTPDVLTTTVILTAGAHVLRWQVLAIDGHITRGDLPFRVTGP